MAQRLPVQLAALVAVLSFSSVSLAPAQSCPPGTTLSTSTASISTMPTTGPWTNLSLSLPQFDGPPSSLVQVDVLVECLLDAEFKAENLSGVGGCPLSWSIGSIVDVVMPSGPAVRLDAIASGVEFLGPFDGTIDFRGPSGVTHDGLTAEDEENVTFTDPLVLASSFVGTGTIDFVHSAADASSHQGCGGLAVVSGGESTVRVTVTSTYCSGTPITSFCAGDGTLATACPCGNSGAPGRGCENSAGTGGALLSATGSTENDTVVLTSSGELATSLSILLQGDASIANGIAFGDGVRCAGGTLKRLFVKNASGGTVSFPDVGDPSIQTTSASLGDPIAPGATRHYQVFYRDPVSAFCAPPLGDGFNVGNALTVVW